MVNNEEYMSEDNLWDLISESKEELIDNKESFNREQTLKRIARLQVAKGAIQQELLKDVWQRVDSVKEYIKELKQDMFNVYKHCINVIISYPINSLIRSLTSEEKERLCRSINRIALVIEFKNLFRRVAVQLAQEQRESLREIEKIVVIKITDVLQRDRCEDLMSVLHTRISRGLKFLRNGGLLLPDH